MTTQDNINRRQNDINEKTQIAISIRTFYGILVIAIGLTSFYLYNNFRIASDIERITRSQEKISVEISYIANGLEKHLTKSEQAQKEMRDISDERNAKFAEIDKKIALIESYFKFGN